MANGIFEPQFVSGSSLRGESFIRQPVEAISGKAIQDLAEGASMTYQAVKIGQAEKEVNELENQFLDSVGEARKETNQIQELNDIRNSNPVESKIYEEATRQMKVLDDSIASRRINPSVALAEREKIRRRVLNHAPAFASRIRSLSGDQGAVFDTETQQMIKETNAIRDAVVDAGLNPDNVRHVEMIRHMAATNAEAKYLDSKASVGDYKSQEIVGKIIRGQVAIQEAVIHESVRALGGIENMTVTQKSELVENLQNYQNGNEQNVVRRLIDANPNVSWANLSDETKEGLYAQVRGSALALQKQLEGGIPKGISENELTTSQNEVFLQVKRDNPDLFFYYTALAKVPSDSVAGKYLGEKLALDMSKYLAGKATGTSGQSVQEMASQGITDPVSVKKHYAQNLEESGRYIANNPDKIDPAYAINHVNWLTEEASAYTAAPQDYLPQEFDAIVNHINLEGFEQVIKNLDQSSYEGFLEQTAGMLSTYSTEVIIPDMNQELNRSVSTQTLGKKTVFGGRKATVKDLVSIMPSQNGGTITFVPNEGITNRTDMLKAEREAKKLNDRYKTRIRNVVRASQKVAGLPDEAKRALVQSYLQDSLEGISEPLRATPDKSEPKQTGITSPDTVDVTMQSL